MGSYMTINIVFPVLNENKRLLKGVDETVRFLDMYPEIDYCITIADNGSDEENQEIGKEIANKYEKVRYFYKPEKGVGGVVRSVFKETSSDIVGYMDVDLATPPKYILTVMDIFLSTPEVCVINASRLLKSSIVLNRKPIREITSRGLNILLSIVFDIKFTDAMCGFKFFRKQSFEYIEKHTSDDKSWFYCAELLIWAEQLGHVIHEIPVEWCDDPNTKVEIWKLIKQYLRRICCIRKKISSINTEPERM